MRDSRRPEGEHSASHIATWLNGFPIACGTSYSSSCKGLDLTKNCLLVNVVEGRSHHIEDCSNAIPVVPDG